MATRFERWPDVYGKATIINTNYYWVESKGIQKKYKEQLDKPWQVFTPVSSVSNQAGPSFATQKEALRFAELAMKYTFAVAFNETMLTEEI